MSVATETGRRRRSWRSVFVVAVTAAAWIATAAAAWLYQTANIADQRVNVRFAEATPDPVRAERERAHLLLESRPIQQDTWSYRLGDRSRAAVERLVRDPAVADTSHIDRRRFRVTLDRPDLPDWLRDWLETAPLGPLTAGLLVVALALTLVGSWSTGLARPGEATRTAARWTMGAVGFGLAAAFFAFLDNGPEGDEVVHFQQITRFLGGDWTVEPLLTTLPGFHALVAALMTITGTTSFRAARVAAFALALCAVWAFHRLASVHEPTDAAVRTAQFVALPILFPQFFLVYTDVASLALVLLMYAAASRKRYVAAGLLGLAACLVRQNNIIWVLLACGRSYVDDNGWRPVAPAVVVRYIPFLFGAMAMAVFVALNGGQVALGDVEAHRLGTPHLGNVFFLLFLTGLLCAPLWWAYRWESLARLRQPIWWAALVVVFAVYWFGFSADHPYNRYSGFLRNDLLRWAAASASHRLAFFLPMALTVVSLPSLRLREHGWLLYAAIVVSLLPSWLIEQRYYLIPFALVLAERAMGRTRDEWLQAGFGAAVSVVLFLIVERDISML